MPIVLRVTEPVDSFGVRVGDLVVVDPDEADYPISIVRALPKEQLVSVLRRLDAFELLSPAGPFARLFEAAGLGQPPNGPGRPSAPQTPDLESEAS